ncbi:DNA polymerase III subunit epsilon [Candidatus Beckwithbacteria bacterium CG23_combo_of_CG06-09_8_20_14_all_47_9]|uniref:DNA polymerase III subunit epsilon n=1 Tax=Candidatus Beckwithbacteria bacterium CG23_combo_of_CG06-09_8_20_14_all_47_9 TaxID=1974498 RepID=A0A2H0B4B6_9BACT|nr:MAG: DNA polymerase III subunit epsilon [Candidatus Beckwithbacteria bacterium CG23_combo_of_CG06-09_8_20_14_all_47_9]
MSPRPETYISVDVEASGPIPGEFSLLSIGACVVTNTGQNFYSELKPLNDNFIAGAMEVNGLSLAKLKLEGEEPTAAMARFRHWIEKVSADTKPVFVGFNATFDWSFTHWYFIKFLGAGPFGISGLDIKAYFMGRRRVLWQETNKKKVRALYPSQTRHTHNALDDAKEQAEIFAGMLK